MSNLVKIEEVMEQARKELATKNTIIRAVLNAGYVSNLDVESGFDGLYNDAIEQAKVYVLMNTGTFPSELALLSKEEFDFDGTFLHTLQKVAGDISKGEYHSTNDHLESDYTQLLKDNIFAIEEVDVLGTDARNLSSALYLVHSIFVNLWHQTSENADGTGYTQYAGFNWHIKLDNGNTYHLTRTFIQ